MKTTETETMNKNTPLNFKIFLSMIMADIDIFLLKEEDQETDKDKLYTKEEIRNQLHGTLNKVLRVLRDDIMVDIDAPLFDGEDRLRKAGFSEYQIKQYRKLNDEHIAD